METVPPAQFALFTGGGPEWVSASGMPPALGDDIHLWSFDLRDPGPGRLLQATSGLTKGEFLRSKRFVSEVHRHRYILGHAGLRRVLGLYLGQPGWQVEFSHGPHGKPHLTGGEGIEFNFTHSEDLALLAVRGNGQPVGIDVEARYERKHMCEIAAKYFSPAEAEEVRATPEHERPRVFARAWTRHEAMLKATGEGLMGNRPPEGTYRTFTFVVVEPYIATLAIPA